MTRSERLVTPKIETLLHKKGRGEKRKTRLEKARQRDIKNDVVRTKKSSLSVLNRAIKISLSLCTSLWERSRGFRNDWWKAKMGREEYLMLCRHRLIPKNCMNGHIATPSFLSLLFLLLVLTDTSWRPSFPHCRHSKMLSSFSRRPFLLLFVLCKSQVLSGSFDPFHSSMRHSAPRVRPLPLFYPSIRLLNKCGIFAPQGKRERERDRESKRGGEERILSRGIRRWNVRQLVRRSRSTLIRLFISCLPFMFHCAAFETSLSSTTTKLAFRFCFFFLEFFSILSICAAYKCN